MADQNKKTADFLTKEEIKKKFNTTRIVEYENILQVQHYLTKEFHYLVENCYGWNILGVTSIYPIFGE
jgi:hypothetical protein